MSQSGVIEKILKSHLAKGKLVPGEEIAVKIDQTLTQDATGTMAYLEFEAMGISKTKTSLSVSYVDHNTIQDGFENADDHKYLRTIAAKYGILYSKAGNGVCHQVHLERFARPGEILLGSDSHTPTAGGIGMIGIGVGGLDVALAMSGKPFYFNCPKIVKINLHGKLSPWSSAKDVILTILKLLSTKGNVGIMIEYNGEGVGSLSIPERATITNMGAELGVTSSVFPSDRRTLQFLKAQGRQKDWMELVADDGAKYEKVIDIDLNKIVPMIAQPHSPDNVCSVKEVAGKKVNQVCIGSCTNSSYRDLMLVAGLLKNKKVHPEVSLVVTPGSRQVLKMISTSLSDLISAGARITEPCCGFCIGNSHAPQTDGVSIRTTNRNFYGRSGTKTAQLYLTSPETAVACALKGVITDPRDLGEKCPKIKTPEKFIIDDSMIFKPSDKPETIKIYRGPNIGDPPKNVPLPESIKGKISIKIGDKITTDHIMPAGLRLKYRSNIKKYAEYVFESVDPSFPSRCLENKNKGIDNIIVAGLSYGQGSSREHAAICPMCLGVKVVIAKSFERIHMSNLINFGILPLVFVNQNDYNKLNKSDEIEITDLKITITENKNLILNNKTKNTKIELSYSLTERQKQIIFAGRLLSYE